MTDYTPPLFDHALNQDELNRQLLWKRQRTLRAQFRARQQVLLQGNPLAVVAAQHRWQPWIDHAVDMSLAPMPDDPDSSPPSNQDLNT